MELRADYSASYCVSNGKDNMHSQSVQNRNRTGLFFLLNIFALLGFELFRNAAVPCFTFAEEDDVDFSTHRQKTSLCLWHRLSL